VIFDRTRLRPSRAVRSFGAVDAEIDQLVTTTSPDMPITVEARALPAVVHLDAFS
jgi:hypothetical protein